MAQPNFDYQGALDAGYSQDEIGEFVSQMTAPQKPAENPQQQKGFDIEGAMKAGYSEEEIQTFLESQQQQQPERSNLSKAGRVAGQYGLGVAQGAMLPYEIAVMGIDSKPAQVSRTRDDIASDVENLYAKKASGDWSEKDEEELHNLRELWKNPDKIEKEIAHEPIDLSIPGLVEGATGISTHPEGVLEKAANWMGFIKDPKKITSLAQSGMKTKDIAKVLAPSGSEAMRGLSAGTALELAEGNNFGPIGTMAAAIVGDLSGGLGVGLFKVGKRLLTDPKKYMAEVAAKFTPNEKVALQKEIIKDFREAGIQADLGTITDSDLIKFTQSRLAQSGLTGKALDDLKTSLTTQIKEEYKALADSLGEAKLVGKHEAGLVAKEAMKTVREADLNETRKLYENSKTSLKPNSYVNPLKLASTIRNLERELRPGSIKSGEQQAVLDALTKVKKDIYSPEGNIKMASVQDLINNKTALNDIINYEVQGGAKQLLKGVVAELDRAIISHAKDNQTFAKNYIAANKKFSEHAKTFRNKTARQLLGEGDPTQIVNKMNSVQGIQDVKKMMGKSPVSAQIFENLKRHKLDEIVGNNLIDSTSQQAKLGTFSKLLEKGKNKEVVKELLGAEAFKRLERLQKNAGRLADAAQKFYNASKSGVVAADAAILAKGLSDISYLLMGNPWPLAKTVGGIVATRKLSALLSDPAFLKLTEDVILASEKGTEQQLVFAVEKLRPYFLESKEQMREEG